MLRAVPPGYQKFNDLWIFQSTWTSVASPWEPRSGLQAMVLNQSLLVMGGNGKYVQDMYNDVWSLAMSLGLDSMSRSTSFLGLQARKGDLTRL